MKTTEQVIQRECLSDDELAEALTDRSHTARSAHLAECCACWQRYDAIVNALAAVAEHADALLAPMEERIPLILRLRSEERAARRLFRQCGIKHVLELLPIIQAHKQLWTASVVRRLLAAIDVNYHSWKATETLVVAELAVTIVEGSSEIPARVRCLAWRDHGIALRQVGRLRDAEASLQAAYDLALSAGGEDSHEAGLVFLARAELAREADRPYDASALLDRARRIFALHEDAVRERKAREQELAVFYKLGRYEEAKAGFEELLATSDPGSPMAAMQLANIGQCFTRLGDYAGAKAYFDRAALLYDRLDMKAPSARALRSLGRIEIRQFGAGAVETMERAKTSFARLGMVGEEILTDLALVEELISLGDRGESVADICRALVSRAFEAGMDVVAVSALTTLRENLREATPDFVRGLATSIDAGFMVRSTDTYPS